MQNNKWVRRAGWLLAGLVILWGLGWLAVPPLVKSQAEKAATEQLGRQVRIGRVDFKPWSLELTVEDIAVATADGKGEQLRVERFYIDAELQSLVRLAPVVDAIAIQGPHLKIKHLGAGRYDIDDVLERLRRPSDQPPGDPLQFALYNLELANGTLDFEDVPLGKTHELRGLHLSVPFLSNLDSQREVKTAPRLAFALNGSRFDSAAEATPFAASRKADATIHLAGLDLAAYAGYLPAGLPVQLQAALLDADLKVSFVQAPQMSIAVSGTLAAREVKLADAQSQELLAFDALKLAVQDLRPLERSLKLSSLEWERPRASLRRDRAGRLNLVAPSGAQPSPSELNATENIAKGVGGAGAAGQKGAKTQPWKLELAQLAVRDGAVAWLDEAPPTPARLELRELALQASEIVFPFAQPLQFKGSASLAQASVSTQPAAATPAAANKRAASARPRSATRAAPSATAMPSAASLRFEGQATDQAATVQASLAGLPLVLGAPYLAEYLEPALGGELGAELAFDWKAPKERGEGGEQLLRVSRLVLDKFNLRSGEQTPVAFERLQISETEVDLLRQTATVGKLVLTRPSVRLQRAQDKRWMFESWAKTQAAPAGAPSQVQAQAKSGPAWRASIGELSVEAGALDYEDRAMAKPVAFGLSALQLRMAQVDPASTKPSALTLSTRLLAGGAEPARISYRGNVVLANPAAQGEVEAVRVPLQAFEPYFADALNVELRRADASFKGQVSYAAGSAGPTVRLSGDSAVEDLRVDSLAPGSRGPLAGNEQLLNWKALGLRGLSVALAPGTATTVEVRETVLSDFFSRVVIHENGRINLQDLVKTAGEAPAPQAAAGVAPAAPAASAPTSASASASGPSTDPVIRFGPISLVNGRVAFSDRFVRPNYSANLSELTGKLGSFSSTVAPGAPPQLAELELRGRAEGTASLEITGQLNPLAKPLALDIRGKVRDLELPPLSTYSIKYAGHGIERGKLSVDVAYKVLPDGQLTASNRLVLNQLSFGEKVEGAPASLPVKLAVALLADRNGVIDVDLPISGSLNDPQFSLGPVIFKVIVNLIVKAVTSPFSLLAGAFGGGGDELSQIAFAPGSSALDAEARGRLDKVAQALADRPALRMTVAGTASLEAEREAYRRERLNQLLRAEKRRAAVVAPSGAVAGSTSAGTSTAAVSAAAVPAAAPVTVSEAEYPVLLKEVYKRADIAKPRNLVGLAKDLPAAEMEALLLANIAVTSDAMRELALRRGVVVRDYLASRQLPTERLFLGAAKTADAQADFKPRAELSLAGP